MLYDDDVKLTSVLPTSKTCRAGLTERYNACHCKQSPFIIHFYILIQLKVAYYFIFLQVVELNFLSDVTVTSRNYHAPPLLGVSRVCQIADISFTQVPDC